ncbi:helix-turn-helix transcriptional regulator [Lacticaseibacillus parakribbianus]|uniref:helix-turn-helix transcriptional regulator n=1 Tax=Lacticaseibacillus parakribbianus TaxID=2970927 RepID=UPI0021CB21A9|nr:AraC family transcriptional regulator [Lacticaseibacillus parakribbianus]
MFELKTFAPDILYAFTYHNARPGTYPYHAHAFLEMSIMLSGTSDYTIEGATTRITPGQVLLFNPGVHHQETQRPGTESTQLHIGFRQIALPGVKPDTLPFADSVVALGDQAQAFFACARRIAAESINNGAFGHQLLVQAEVVELLCLLMRALPDNRVAADRAVTTTQAEPSVDQQALVASATYYLEAHYQEAVTLADLASDLHVSAAHLSRTFKAVRGESPMSYLTALRMKKATQILKETDLPINQVATSVGYQDPFYFSRLFKQHYGEPPSTVQGRS